MWTMCLRVYFFIYFNGQIKLSNPEYLGSLCVKMILTCYLTRVATR